MKMLYEQIKAHIEKINKAYKARANKNSKGIEYQPSVLVWLHLRKNRFPTKKKRKLMPSGDKPFKVLAKVGVNAYKLELLGDMSISATFNIGDLSPYVEDDINLGDLRENPPKGGKDDAC